MGSFHPHGDQAIYDALVRLAQDFSSRYPLIDGRAIWQYRRRWCRCLSLHRSADDDVARFCSKASMRTRSIPRELFGDQQEPIVLPAALPNLLPMARRALRLAWQPPSRRIISPNSATRPLSHRA